MFEAGRSPRGERRLQGKDDGLDATRAARTVLSSETLALPRAGQRREALRLLMVARRSAVDVRREALTQLRSVIVTAPDELRQELRGLSQTRLLERCSRLRRSSNRSPEELAATLVLRSLARRVQSATAEATELQAEILAHVRALAPPAARRTRSRADRGRPTDRRAGPTQAASAPKQPSHGSPASPRSPPHSAKPSATDSAAAATDNSTGPLHRVILHRRRHHPATRDYIARRVAEGKTSRDAVRLTEALPRPPPATASSNDTHS